jgi:hypothetical protein
MTKTLKDVDMSRNVAAFLNRMNRAPDMPAMNPEKAKTISLARPTLMPRKSALFWFDLMLRGVSPKGVRVKYQQRATQARPKKSTK